MDNKQIDQIANIYKTWQTGSRQVTDDMARAKCSWDYINYIFAGGILGQHEYFKICYLLTN